MVEEVKSPIFATGIGLVLRGLSGDKTSGAISNSPLKSDEKQEKGTLFSRIATWLKDEVDVEDFK